MKSPELYDGTPDLTVFDNWVASVVTYAKVMKIKESTMINMMGTLMTGTAQAFWVENVAMKAEKWTFVKFFEVLFLYCFPTDTMRKLRAKWNNLTQGKKHVREYV